MTANELELAPLTARQRLFAELVADGHTDKEICAMMRIRYGTVRYFMDAIAEILHLDRTKNLRVQLAWLVIHDRHLQDPQYRVRLPSRRAQAA